MKKYEELSDFIIENVGGMENIKSLTNCVTRLRFKLYDNSKVNEERLKNHEDIMTTLKSAGLQQVVIGNHVGEVCTVILSKLGKQTDTETNASTGNEKKSILNRFLEMITKVITPILGILCATGVIQGLVSLLIATNVLVETDGAYIILNSLGQALFYFFPIILGYTSAEAFGVNKFTGMILGAALVFPGLTESMTSGTAIYSLFSGTIFSTEIYSTFFGIPIMFPKMGYASTVIPIIISIFFTSKIEKKISSKISERVGFVTTPLLTLLIALPLTILLIGPIANFLNILVLFLFESLYGFSPIVASIIQGLLYQPLVVFGLHWPMVTIAINNFVNLGYDYIVPVNFTGSFAQMAVVLAVFYRTKSQRTKTVCIPALISGLFGIIEPAMYGVLLKEKKRFVISCVSAAVGSVIITLFGAKMYSLCLGVLGFVTFINPNGNATGVFTAIIATIIVMILAFTIAWITFKEDDESSNTERGSIDIKGTEQVGSIKILSPLKGTAIPLEEIEDSAFSENVLGKGIAINPAEGRVYAPFNATVSTFFPTGHAIGLVTEDGIELLIHVGINTVYLGEDFFSKKVCQGDAVKKGDLLLEFDLEGIKRKGVSAITPVIITNTNCFFDVLEVADKEITYFQDLLTIIK